MLAVAGTHGKTTTSSMLAWILEHAGLEPGFLIGGVPTNFGVSARRTAVVVLRRRGRRVRHRVLRQALEVRPLPAATAILNNLEYDHADIFPDLAAIETQFHHLVRTVPRSGRLVVNGGDAALARVARARLLVARSSASASPRCPRTGPGWTIAVDGTILLGGAPQGTLRWPAARRSSAATTG